MAIFKALTFDGVNSLDYGIYITGEAVYNAPERAVEMINIPGKNGALALDQGRFENIEVTYHAGCFADSQTDFADKVMRFRNALASRYTYKRLTDEYHPDEYRLGLYKSGLDVDAVRYGTAGEFDITFNCKPQRFLTSGEEPVDTSELAGDVTTNRDPYLFRRSGGGNIGHDFDAEIDKLVGGTVAWNQLAPSNYSKGSSGSVAFNSGTSIVEGHKYLITRKLSANVSIGNSVYVYTNGSAVQDIRIQGTNTAIIQQASYSGTSDGTTAWNEGNMWIYQSPTSDPVTVTDLNIIDLTQMFGPTIADAIYAMEQSTAGAGVAWFRKLFPKPYYAYNAGELKSVSGLVSHDMTGFNQWDEEWEQGAYNNDTGAKTPSNVVIRSKNYIQILPNTSYCFRSSGCRVFYYDADYNYLGTTSFGANYVFTTPINAYYMNFQVGGTTYNHDICINISKTTGSPKNGDYVAYDGHSYPLDSDLELRGLFKLDANNNLYADGDVYESSGAVSRKYGYRAYQSGDESLADAITDGTNTVYKLTTPTTETADPYASPQVVNPLGTEEYVDTRDVPVPVGHETEYGMSQLVLSNPTEFPSKPLLEVTGVGTFWLGDTLFTITGTAGQTIYIDCETGEAWKNTGGIITPANGLVTLNRLDFPELDPGDTPVMYGTGITKVVVTPRWWII